MTLEKGMISLKGYNQLINKLILITKIIKLLIDYGFKIKNCIYQAKC